MWPTDRPTNQPTDKAGCRVACTRLKSFTYDKKIALISQTKNKIQERSRRIMELTRPNKCHLNRFLSFFLLSNFSRWLSDFIGGCVRRKAGRSVTRNFGRCYIGWNTDFWALRSLPSHITPRTPTYCPCPLALLPLPTRQRLPLGCISSLVFLAICSPIHLSDGPLSICLSIRLSRVPLGLLGLVFFVFVSPLVSLIIIQTQSSLSIRNL